VIVGLFKLIFYLITLPIWLIVWVFKARAVLRAGRKVYPVQVVQPNRPITIALALEVPPNFPPPPPPPSG
jgi:hypothetical protein